MNIEPTNHFAAYKKDFEQDMDRILGPDQLHLYLAYATFRKMDEIQQSLIQFDKHMGNLIWRKEFRDEERNNELIDEQVKTRYFLRDQLLAKKTNHNSN